MLKEKKEEEGEKKSGKRNTHAGEELFTCLEQ